MKEEKLKKWIIDIVKIIVGAAIMAFGISMFLLPSILSTGGISGLATISYYFFKVPMGITNLILNVRFFDI